MFKSMDDEYMRERAADIADISQRMIKLLEGVEILDLTTISEDVIILAHDLTPSETSQLNPKFVKGFITEIGGRTSHSAIMARTLEIPAVVGVGKEIFSLTAGEEIMMDGTTGDVYYQPDAAIAKELLERGEKLAKAIAEQQSFKDKHSESSDG